MGDKDEIMYISDVARETGLSRSMIHKLIHSGELQPIPEELEPGRIRPKPFKFYRSDVEQFIARRQAQRKTPGRVD